jgi:hypothetical protein
LPTGISKGEARGPSKNLEARKMNNLANAKIAMPPVEQEVQEVKRSLPLRKVEGSLSEFDRARQASKTWSMGQD